MQWRHSSTSGQLPKKFFQQIRGAIQGAQGNPFVCSVGLRDVARAEEHGGRAAVRKHRRVAEEVRAERRALLGGVEKRLHEREARVVVSHGEAVDLTKLAAAGKFTVYDFGAPWCEPCYGVADALKVYLGQHNDTAVRAVVLDAGDPKQSFALPVVKQYLEFAAGLESPSWLSLLATKRATTNVMMCLK